MEVIIVNKAIKGDSRYKHIKWGIFIAGVSVFAQLYNFQPLLSQITYSFQITPSKSSLTVSITTIGMAMGLLIFSFIADSFSRKKIMFFSLITSSILTLISAYTHHYEVLLFINFTKGLCISGISAVTLAYLVEEINPSNIGIAISFYLAGNTFGGMAGRLIASLVSYWFNWRISVLTIGVMGFITAIAFEKTFPTSIFFTPLKLNTMQKFSSMKNIFSNKIIVALYITAFCLIGSFVSVYNYLGFKLEATPFNLPHYLIAFIFLMYVFGILGNILGGTLSDKISPKKILYTSIILVSAGLIMISSNILFIIVLGLLIITISFYCAHTIAGRLVTQFAEENRTSATALYWFFFYMGSSIIGSSTGVFINHNNWNGFFITLTSMALFSLLSVLYTIKSR